MAEQIERFRYDPIIFVGVTCEGRLIFVGVKSREDFDAIDLPLTDCGENERGHVLAKSIDNGTVRIIFQHWLKSLTVEAMMADRRAREAAAASAPAQEGGK